MRKPADPRELAVALLRRSTCMVQVAAVLADSYGISSWGWNNSGADGLGEHAEAHCMRRANRRRSAVSTIYVAAKRRRNGKAVTAKPCPECARILKNVGKISYRDSKGVWHG